MIYIDGMLRNVQKGDKHNKTTSITRDIEGRA